MTRHLSASAVAQLIGIKTGTFAKWRREGRGPAGWFHVSTTLVVYPMDEVERYLAEQKRTASGH
ncbi:MAG: DNA-binding protein [Acidobacteria bacterium]|nr:MAG: DNA-binding protein [Acidobacteriota bacterium]